MPELAVRRTKSAPAYFKAVTGAGVPDGTFDAIVAVFNNVDLGGDRIIPGAFAKTLAQWRAAGDPIPVIFSHQWDNLSAHIGEVDPKNVTELEPGDERLPAELKDLGGLLVEGAQVDLEAEGEAGSFARNLWGKLKKRLIKEFSFAYEVPAGGARPTKDATDLLEVGLIEIGPTLKGMNPATALLDAKAARKAIEGLSTEAALELLDELVPIPPAKAVGPVRVKRLAASRPAGAIEDTLATIASCARLWASMKYGRELYACHVEGTFLEAGKALITAERWDDPYGEGPLWELSYELDDAGAIITDAKAVEATVTLNALEDAGGAKRRAKAHLDAGADRKTALWLTLLDDQGAELVYGDPMVQEDPIGETSTGFASRAAYIDAQRGQARGATTAKGEEPSAANSPTGVLLEIEELELSTD